LGRDHAATESAPPKKKKKKKKSVCDCEAGALVTGARWKDNKIEFTLKHITFSKLLNMCFMLIGIEFMLMGSSVIIYIICVDGQIEVTMIVSLIGEWFAFMLFT
jgi:hypothetical protein